LEYRVPETSAVIADAIAVIATAICAIASSLAAITAALTTIANHFNHRLRNPVNLFRSLACNDSNGFLLGQPPMCNRSRFVDDKRSHLLLFW
jgi:hypothetical protein